MRVCVVGLGYVGTAGAACLAAAGHEVVGVDLDSGKLAVIASGRSPVLEERIDDLVASGVAVGRLRVTVDTASAVAWADVTLVCVGTPSHPDGALDTTALERAADDVGSGLAVRPADAPRATVVFRSTMLPGTCADRLVPRLEKSSGLCAGLGFGVAVHPEFLREGSSVADFERPPKTVVGELDEASGDAVLALVPATDAPVFRVPLAVAEMTKYADNAFHALKVGFANELGALARGLGLDSRDVVEVFLADRTLNVSEAYLRPGFAFGGSCLPKDLRALVHAAGEIGVDTPILSHVLPSNDVHVERTVEHIAGFGRRAVGVFGLAFKAGTDDVRESPLVDLCRRLVDRGYDVRAYDPLVDPAALVGANRSYLAERLPDAECVIVSSPEELVAHGDTLVVGRVDPGILSALAQAGDAKVVDLVRLPDAATRRETADYVGLAW